MLTTLSKTNNKTCYDNCWLKLSVHLTCLYRPELRGFRENEFKLVGDWIVEIIDSVKQGNQEAVTTRIRKEVMELCGNFPIY